MDMNAFALTKQEQKYVASDLDNSPLLKKLQVLNATVVDFSTVSIVDLPKSNKPPLLSSVESADIIVFVSRYAAFLACRQLGQSVFNTKVCLAIGESSEEVLETFGVKAISPKSQTSVGLMSLPEMSDLRGKSVLIFKGQGGLNLIEEQSRELGALVNAQELYKRVPSLQASELIRKFVADNLNHMSTLGLSVEVLASLKENLLQSDHVGSTSLWAALSEKKLIVISDRIAASSERLGFTNILVAKSSDKLDMVSSISELMLD